MSNNQKQLDKIIRKLNTDISKNQFNIQLNEKIIQIIINIYRASREGNISKITLLIEQIKIIYGVSDVQEFGELCNSKESSQSEESLNRSWDFSEDDEEIACGEIESITGIFLQNLKKYNENKK